MNILIISEQYTMGGLESQIRGQCRVLQQLGHNVFLACGKADEEAINKLQINGSLTGLRTDLSMTPMDLFTTVKQLQEYIKRQKIDLLHIHPYVTLIPGFIAAEEEKIPYVITVHNNVILKSFYGPLYSYVLRNFVFPCASNIFCVSEETKTFADLYADQNKIVLLPNAVNTNQFTPFEKKEKGKWALASRIDSEKIIGIKESLRIFDRSRISSIDIYGDGPSLNELKEFSSQNILNTQINYKGHVIDLSEHLMAGCYEGLAGMGRVAIEGMASNLLVALVGYDGLKGLLSKELVEKARWWNFSGRGLPNIDETTFNSQLNKDYLLTPENFLLRDWVMKNADEDQCWSEYYSLISSIPGKHKWINKLSLLSIINGYLNSDLPYLQNQELLSTVQDMVNKENLLTHSSTNTDVAFLKINDIHLSSISTLMNSLTKTSKQKSGNQASLPITSSKKSISTIYSRAKWIVDHEGYEALFRAIKRNLKKNDSSFNNAPTTLDHLDNIETRNKNLWDVIQNDIELRKGIEYKGNSGKKTVAYFTNQLLDWNDQRPRFGGGERYCITLVNLLTELGFTVDIFQLGPKIFTGEYYGYKVRSIISGEFFSEFNIEGANFFYEISRKYDHVVYNMPELCAAKMRVDAISICHGIWFDHNNYSSIYRIRSDKWFQHLYRAFNNPQKIVSVDTNSINVIRSLFPELATKMTFIPNFVDKSLFFPPKEDRDNSKLMILFPRRSQINRGSRILADIIKNVNHDVDFYWIGEGDDGDTKLIRDLCVKDSRLHYGTASFDEMPDWYRRADIAVIPTIASEGTSLACIEALASGCAVVATNVGGLIDLVKDGVNGRSVNPSGVEIAKAINELIENPDKLKYYQQKGYESSSAYSLEKWKEKWIKVLSDEHWIDPAVKEDEPFAIHRNLNKKIAIVTRNAYHGGVESLIKIESEMMPADVIVAGGYNDPLGTCPFPYVYVTTYEELYYLLQKYDVVLYHWPMDWALQAIHDSGLPSIEYVHRTDTSDCDKSIPLKIVTHSKYIVDYLKDNFSVDAILVPNAIDTSRFYPDKTKRKKVVGAITSYYETKGIDVVIKAWAKVQPKFPEYTLRFYGSGLDLDNFKKLASTKNVAAQFMGPVNNSPEIMREYSLFISGSRIEGLPITLLEALSENIPVIASDIEGHRVINETFKNEGFPEPIHLFESENYEDLADKIDQMLSSEKNLEVNSSEAIAKLYSSQLHISKLLEIIEEIENEKKPIIKFDKVDQTRNNGVYSSSKKSEGFLLDEKVVNSSIQPLSISSSASLGYRYLICEYTSEISVEILCDKLTNSNVNINFKWLNWDGTLMKTDSIGRHCEESSPMIYDYRHVPVVNGKKAKILEVEIINSSQNEMKINSVIINAYRKMT